MAVVSLEEGMVSEEDMVRQQGVTSIHLTKLPPSLSRIKINDDEELQFENKIYTSKTKFIQKKWPVVSLEEEMVRQQGVTSKH